MNLTLKAKCSLSLLIGLGLSLWLGVSVAQAQCPNDLCYVDANGTSLTPDGMSWASAFANLQDALTVAISGTEIWVAAGVYRPDEGGGQTNDDVTASFALTDGVKLYGGFAATETARSQRQPRVNVTVLSGDIDGNDGTDSQGVVTTTANITGSNAYHVIFNRDVSSTAVLDGFTITAGDVNVGGVCPDNNNCGGGMYNIRSSPVMSQISFSGNRAGAHGGGMVNWENSNPKMSQISFSGNSANSNGGGMFNSASHPEMSQVSFSGNTANQGGGMFNQLSSRPEMSQVSFSGNSANQGGGMYNIGSNPHIVNSIFWGNAASGLTNAPAQIHNLNSNPVISDTLVQSSGGSSAWDNNLGSNGGNNLDADPRFREPIDPADAPTSAGNLRLRRGSPAINAGDDRAASGPLDLDGAPRIQGGRVDLGAYETPAPYLSLSKAVSPVRVELDQRVTYTLVLSNSGAASDTVRLTDTVPSGVEFAAWVAQGGAMENANEISWQGLVTAGESITITFAGTNRSLGGSITNMAQFSGSLQAGSSRASYSVFRPRVYVDANGTSLTPDGIRWTSAYTNLQDALAVAIAGTEIWVAAGVYYPDEGGGQTNDDVRAKLALTDGVKLYGGFAGTETQRSQRQPRTNVTVLSGDIDGNDGTDSQGVVTTTANISGSNAYHVIYSRGVGRTTVLDGFTITAGQAVGAGCPDACGGGMYNSISSPKINQISFSGNSAANGGGMYNFGSSPVMSQVSFSDNLATNIGGGMYNYSSSPVMSQVTFSGNFADGSAGGMYNTNRSDPEMSQVTFSGNRAIIDAGGMFNINTSDPEMSQVTFSGNFAGSSGGGMVNSGSNPKMSQVSFSGNRAVRFGGGMYNWTSNPWISNSIFWGNGRQMNAWAQIVNANASNPLISDTLIQGSDGNNAWLNILANGGHNLLDADPRFREPIDPANAPTRAGNLRLEPGCSPAIDAGDDRAASGLQDLDGATRIQGAGVDLGAYESRPPITLVACVSLSKAVSAAIVEAGQRVTYTLVLSNSGAASDTVRLSDTLPSGVEFAAWVTQGGAMENANVISWQDTLTAGESITTTFVVTNLNLNRAITNRAQFRNSGRTASTSVSHIVLRQFYVDASGTSLTPDGLSWTLAYTSLQDALAVAIAGDEIWVAAGVYYPDEGRGRISNNRGQRFNLRNGVKIYGGFAATETQRSQRQPRVNVTVLSGDIDHNDVTDSHGVVTTTANITGSNAYHVIRNIGVSSTTVLDGFTITAGQADVGGNNCPDNCGGGMLNIRSSLVISQVSFSGNSAAVNGGGMFNDRSNPEMSQISFSGNSAATNGGGMYNIDNSNPEMSQISFSGNSAATNGGGMYNIGNSNPEMSQVSFSGNNAANFGGGMYNIDNSNPEMSQVSFSGNRADNGGGMFNTDSNPQIINSIFWGNAESGLINARAQIHNAGGSNPVSSYTLIQGSGGSGAWDNNLGINGGHNLDADPLFEEPIDPFLAPTSAGNLRLEDCSPAIDAGDDRAASGPLDLAGAPRIQGRGVDLGAYESRPPLVACVSLSKAVNPVRVDADQRVTYTLVLRNSGGVNDSVRLTDTVPSGVEFAAWVAQGGAQIIADEISWQDTVPAGESITIIFAGTNRILSGGIIITNTAQFSGSRQAGSSRASYSVFRPRVYVDAAVMPPVIPNGVRWTSAYTNLQDALAVATDGTEIWVAAGVYYPDEGGGQTNNDVTASFALTDGVKLYGGFAATETERSQRQPRTNVTVLSGDIDGNDDTDSHEVVTTTNNITGTNARHVIFNRDVSSTAVLDGFTITAGDVNVGGFCPGDNNCGGGMYNIRSSPEINQISFRGNRAGGHGGGMVNWDNSHPKMSQISFSGNTATHHGGGMLNDNSRPEMSQVSFSGNRANIGGGMFNQTNSNPKMSQVSFSGNSAVSNGGGMYNQNSNPHIVNSIFWANAANGLINAPAQIANTNGSSPIISYTLIQSSGGSSAWDNNLGSNGGNNLDADPLFREPIDPAHAPTSAGNLRLEPGSPAIDAGDDRAASGPLDLAGAPRIQGRGVDLGAYETPGPYITLAKLVSPALVEPDQRVTYTLLLINSGLVSDSVRLTDTLPSGVEFAAWGAQGGAQRRDDEISWQDTVTARESITITFAGTNRILSRSIIIINTAQFSGSLHTGSSSVNYSVLNVRPFAADDTYSTDEDTRLTIISPTGILANDGDRNGDSLQIFLLNDVSSGTLDLQLDGSFVYTPAADVNGQDYFSYIVNDGVLNDMALVTITIAAVNDAPVAFDDTDRANEDEAVSISVLSNDVDVDNSRLSLTAVSPAQNGRTSISGQQVVYSPSLNFAGTDSFTYRVSDGSLSDTASVTVTVNAVNDAPLAEAGADQSVRVSQSVTLDGSRSSDVEGDALRYGWQQTGGPRVTLNRPSLSRTTFIAPAVPTILTFRLSVTDEAGLASRADEVVITVTTVTEEAIAGLRAQNSSPAALNEVITFTAHITAGDNVTYRWDFGDGGSAGGQEVTYLYLQTGTYTAKVEASNSTNRLTATTGVTITDMTGRSVVTIAGLTVQNSSPAAVNEVITFTANIRAGDGVNYRWDFGDGVRAVGQRVSHVYTQAGRYIATVLAINSINRLTATTGVTVTEEAIAGLRAQNSSPAALNEVITFTAHITAGEGVNYTWHFGDGGSAGGQEVTYLYLQTGTYTARVEASNSTNRLTATTGVTITDMTGRSVVTIAGLTVQNSSPAAVNEVITFTANIRAGDGVNYRWDFGDGFRAVGQIVSHVYRQTGRYTATVLAINSINRLTATTGVTITSMPEPSDEAIAGLSVQNSSPTAVKEVITFTASITAGTNVSYTWDFGDGGSDVGQEVTHVYSQAGTYTVRVLASNSTNTRTATTGVTITSMPEPSDEAIAGLSVQNSSPTAVNEVITFTASITAGDNVTYTWDFGDGGSDVGKIVTHVYPQAGTYIATVEASNSINRLTATTGVRVTEEAIAGLSVQNSPVTLNEVVTFTANIAAGTNVNYIWDFGDGGSDVGQEVTHVYNQAGTYTVRVEASNSTNSLTATTVVSIIPIERPEIDVTDYLNPDLRLENFTAYQGMDYSYTVKVSPSLMRAQTLRLPATQVYRLSAPTKPAWLDFVDHQDNTGTLRGVPGAADRGEQAVTILATDGQVSSTAVFTLTVGPNQVYLPLVFK